MSTRPIRARVATAAAAATVVLALLAAPVAAPAAGGRHAFTNATIYPIAGEPIEEGFLRVADGKIVAVGAMGDFTAAEGEEVHDAKGASILPGLIDTHSHMGVYSWPNVEANSDGNEMTAPVTAQVRAQDAINLEDPAFFRAVAGGVTTIQVLPGSGNLIGGESVVLKLKLGGLLDDMKFPGAPRGIKMAMGENPKRVYGERGEMPSTRMGIVAKLREVFTEAREYRDARDRHALAMERYGKKLAEYEADKAAYPEKLAEYERKKAAGDTDADRPKDPEEPEKPEPPTRNLLSETLVDVMEHRVRVNVHCYRKDDLLDYLRVADEFGFAPHSFHHGLECYKIAPELAKRGISVVTWPDWWGFKHEAYDATPWNMAILMGAGVNVAIHSDSSVMVQRFLQEAAKAVKYGVAPQDALRSITLNPAKVLGIDQWVGTLEAGKHADFCIVDGEPLSIYTRVRETWIDGEKMFDRATDGDVF